MGYRKIIIPLLFLILSGCGYYSFKGALPPELKTIYIENFQTNVAFYNVEQNLTFAVENAFLMENVLQIVNNKEEADLILKGKIVNIDWDTYTVEEGASQAKEDKLNVTVSVDCYRTDLKKSLWKKKWDRFSLLDVGAGQAETEDALLIIIEQMSEDIVLYTVAVW